MALKYEKRSMELSREEVLGILTAFSCNPDQEYYTLSWFTCENGCTHLTFDDCDLLDEYGV